MCNIPIVEKKYSLKVNKLQKIVCYTDVFDKFKNKEWNFKLELGEHISGLMGLYEALEVSINEEDILNEAKDFSRHFLEETSNILITNKLDSF